MQKVTSAGIITYTKKNNEPYFLLLHYTAGHWDFPKGHLEEGETLEQAAHRELQEESGLNAKILDPFATKFSYNFIDKAGKKINKTVHFFLGETHSNQVILSHEHQDFAWLPFTKAYEKLTYNNAKKALEKANNFISKA